MRVIDFFGESEAIYIVVDRVDRCLDNHRMHDDPIKTFMKSQKPPRDRKYIDHREQLLRDRKYIDHREQLLELFVKMVEAARCKLKILTVVDGNSWHVKGSVELKDSIILHSAEQGTKDMTAS